MAALHTDHVLCCDFAAWHPTFQHLTYRSLQLRLTPDFLNYLLQDGVFAGVGSAALPRRAREAEEDDWSDDEQPEQEPSEAGRFKELYAKIDAGIAKLGGKVVPKLNWSCPVDATWINPTQSLACSNAEEVVLMLKSSDRISHDICEAFVGCVGKPGRQHELVLVLQRFMPLRPEGELRCFVHRRELIAVSQRNLQQEFPELQQQSQDILEKLQDFLEDHIVPRFALKDYAMDVYITSKGAVKLMGFNPIGGTTSPLLYAWEELPYKRKQLPAQPATAPSPAASLQSAGRCNSSSSASALTEVDLQAELLSSGWHVSTPSGSSHGSSVPSRQGSASSASSGGFSSPFASGQRAPSGELKASLASLPQGPGLPPRHRPPAAPRLPPAPTHSQPVHKDEAPCGSPDGSLFSPSDSEGPPSSASDLGSDCGCCAMDGVETDAKAAEAAKRRKLAWESGGVDFRCLQPGSQLAPNLPRQGVPFDLVDLSQGGPVDELLAKLQTGVLT